MFKKSLKNPIIKPDPKIPWRSLATYNSTVIYENKTFQLFYRALGQAFVSKIGHATSKDGIKFKKDIEPAFSPELAIEKNGVEDPRICRIEKTYYMTYTAYDGRAARLCLATSCDLEHWHRHGEMLTNWDFKKAGGFIVDWDSAQKTGEAKKLWSKSGGIFPEKINGKFWMLFGDRNIWFATSVDGIKWQADLIPFLKPRKDNFDNIHIEMGPPPIKTKKGWLVLYHGINEKRTYQLGFALLDLRKPEKILFRADEPLFLPSPNQDGLVDIAPGGHAAMEQMGKEELKIFAKRLKEKKQLPNVIFCNGACLIKNTLHIFYGINDTYIGTATTDINSLLDSRNTKK